MLLSRHIQTIYNTSLHIVSLYGLITNIWLIVVINASKVYNMMMPDLVGTMEVFLRGGMVSVVPTISCSNNFLCMPVIDCNVKTFLCGIGLYFSCHWKVESYDKVTFSWGIHYCTLDNISLVFHPHSILSDIQHTVK